MHFSVDMHLKRTRQEKKIPAEKSAASNERECQQRVGAPSLCLSLSQDGLKGERERERERGDLTANDLYFKASSSTGPTLTHLPVATSLISSQRMLKTCLLFAEDAKIRRGTVRAELKHEREVASKDAF